MNKRFLTGIVCTVFASGLLFATNAQPLVSSAELKAFVGNHSGKIVFTKYGTQSGGTLDKNGRSLWYIDFSESPLVEHQIVDYSSSNVEPRNAEISEDGNWIVYNTFPQSKSYICKLEPNATPTLIDDGAQPHWWTNPGTKEEYVIYNSCDIEECWYEYFFPACNHTWGIYARCTGPTPPTYTKLLNNKVPSAFRLDLVPYYANGGRSKSGKYLFSSSRPTGVYVLDPNAVSNVAVTDTIPFEKTIWGCNPSISPNVSDADVRVMWVNIPHDTIYIAKPTGEITELIGKEDDGSLHWDCPEWSTHPDFCTAAGYDENDASTYDLYLIRISDKKQLKIIEGPANYPHLWVDAPGDRVTNRLFGNNSQFSITIESGILRINPGKMRNFTVVVTTLQGKLIFKKRIGIEPVNAIIGRSSGAKVIQVFDNSGKMMSKSIITTSVK